MAASSVRGSVRAFFHRVFRCRFDRHGPGQKEADSPAKFCPYCGASLRPWPRWEVTLISGEMYQVEGINEWHAGSQVVYGEGPGKIDGHTGRPLNQVKVHRDNIVSIRLID